MSSIIQRLICVCVCASVCVCAGAMLKCQHAFPFPAAPLLPPLLALHMTAHVRRRRRRRRSRCPCRRCRLPFAFCAQLPHSPLPSPPSPSPTDCLPVRAIEISTGAKVIQFNASPGDGQAGSSGSAGESLAYPYITCRESREKGKGRGLGVQENGEAALRLVCSALPQASHLRSYCHKCLSLFVVAGLPSPPPHFTLRPYSFHSHTPAVYAQYTPPSS